MEDEKLRQSIRNLYDEYSREQLPYMVTNKLGKLMVKHNINMNKQSRGVCTG